MTPAASIDVDVAIVGAGPVGLTIANYLGLYGVSAVVLEGRKTLIDYPRGVGMDDECLRVFQAVGLAEKILPHTTPDHWMRFVTAKGRCFASVEPRTREFGWPRRNAFVQPLVDRVLFEGLERFDHVSVRFGAMVEALTQTEDGVEIAARGAEGPLPVRAKLLVGADGGRSTVRKALGIGFEGQTSPTRWVVIDINDDPVGTPNLTLHCDPARPYVSISLPHGIRRLEFMLMKGETEESIQKPDMLRALLNKIVDYPDGLNIIRVRVYTHSARLADRFVAGRVAIAGDAAHLMPVWQGQGFNSGVRDAGNLGWKLAVIAKGLAGLDLLGTYETERRAHARAMISLSVTAGRIFSPTSRIAAGLRDAVMLALNAIPPVKRYLLQMKFKPLPRYTDGIVTGGGVAVGRLFPQPRVTLGDGRTLKLDDALGPWFAVIGWSVDPAKALAADARRRWLGLGARFFVVRPMTQIDNEETDTDHTQVLGDVDGALQAWFGEHETSIAVLRPDRFVAGIATTQGIGATTGALAEKMDSPTPPTAQAQARADIRITAEPLGEVKIG